jgi:hypothetical protein
MILMGVDEGEGIAAIRKQLPADVVCSVFAKEVGHFVKPNQSRYQTKFFPIFFPKNLVWIQHLKMRLLKK